MGFNWETVLQFILLIVALRLLHMVSASDSCSEVRRNFVAKRIGQMKLVPYKAFEAKDLQVCSNSGLTCCTRAMEDRFQIAAKKDVEKVIKYKTSTLKFNFRSFSEKFQDDVEELFRRAGNATAGVLHHHLRQKITSQAMVFTLAELSRLFRSLQLRSTQENVKKAFDRFADKLFLVMLDMAYNRTETDSQYEKCVAQQRINLHPFMDIPIITAANLTSALHLGQALHSALSAGAEAVNVTQSTVLSKSCQSSLLKMQYCSHCLGLTLLKPCMGLCRNVLRGCFAGITELDQYWNYYVSALVDVSEHMRSAESKYNLEIVLQDFQKKLMSSLSVVLENVATLRETVKKRCGNSDTLKRSKRSAELTQEVQEDNYERDLGGKNRNGGKRRERRGRGNSSHARPERIRIKELSKLKEEENPKQTAVPSRNRVRPPHEVLFNAPTTNTGSEKVSEQIVKSRKPRGYLHTRIKRFINSLNLSINFYRHLPDDMCEPRSEMTIEVVNHGKCWDGSNIVDEYPKDVVATGYENQAENPEVKVTTVSKDVLKAIEKLRLATESLLLTVGKADVPGLLLLAPVYRRRGEDVREDGVKRRPEWPCDDEDDCELESGSGGDSNHLPGKRLSPTHHDLDQEKFTPSEPEMNQKNPEKNKGGRNDNGTGTVDLGTDDDIKRNERKEGRRKGKGKKERKKQRGVKFESSSSSPERLQTDGAGNSAESTLPYSVFYLIVFTVLTLLSSQTISMD